MVPKLWKIEDVQQPGGHGISKVTFLKCEESFLTFSLPLSWPLPGTDSLDSRLHCQCETWSPRNHRSHLQLCTFVLI